MDCDLPQSYLIKLYPTGFVPASRGGVYIKSVFLEGALTDNIEKGLALFLTNNL
jgi:hypothetical protein